MTRLVARATSPSVSFLRPRARARRLDGPVALPFRAYVGLLANFDAARTSSLSNSIV